MHKKAHKKLIQYVGIASNAGESQDKNVLKAQRPCMPLCVYFKSGKTNNNITITSTNLDISSKSQQNMLKIY